MNILKINQENIHYLEDFIKQPLSKNFRYFQKRDITCVNNHLITLLGLINNIPIAYGHIDYSQDENKYWLGICILEEYQGKGFGKAILSELINLSNKEKIDELYLSVDKDNINAISLYKKFGFEIIEEKPNFYFMKRF
jgi:ribosomal-protein-alanine N-acetyltransferase